MVDASSVVCLSPKRQSDHLRSPPDMISSTLIMSNKRLKTSKEKTKEGEKNDDVAAIGNKGSSEAGAPPVASVTRTVTAEDMTDAFYESRRKGKSCQEEGNYEQALMHYGEALRFKNRTIDSETKNVQADFADVLFNCGSIHLLPKFNDRWRGLEAFQFCLDTRRSCFGSNHPLVASVLYKLASIHSWFGQHEYAMELLCEALAILMASAPEDKKSLIEVWTAMGKIQETQGHMKDAQESYQEASALKETNTDA